MKVPSFTRMPEPTKTLDFSNVGKIIASLKFSTNENSPRKVIVFAESQLVNQDDMALNLL